MYDYGYEDGKLVFERVGNQYEINYRYDENGNLFTFTRTNYLDNSRVLLYAVNNTRGDLIELRTGSGVIYAKYTYDSWGNLISVTDANGNALSENHAAHYNSIRYRGYVYDRETGLYYLQSRYYDAEVGRFLNADSVDYIGYSGELLSYNMFAYCENNAVNGWDMSGYYYVYSSSISTRSLYQKLFQNSRIVSNLAKNNMRNPQGINKNTKIDKFLYSYTYSKKSMTIIRVPFVYQRIGTKSRTIEYYMFMTYDEWVLYVATENRNIITRFKKAITNFLGGEVYYKLANKALEKYAEYRDIKSIPNISKAIDLAEVLLSIYYEFFSKQMRFIRKILYKDLKEKYKNSKYIIVIPLYYKNQKEELVGLPSGKMYFSWKTTKTYRYY